MSTPEPSTSTGSEALERSDPPKRPDTKPASNENVPSLQPAWRNRGESDFNDRREFQPVGPNSNRGFGRGTYVRGRGMPHPVRERDKYDDRDNSNQRRAMNEFVRRDEYYGDEFASHDSRRPFRPRPERGPAERAQDRGNDENFRSMPARKPAAASFSSQSEFRRRPVDDPAVRRMSRNSDVSDTSVHSTAETVPKVIEEDLKPVVWKTGVKRFSREELLAFREVPNLQQKPEWLPSFLVKDGLLEVSDKQRSSRDAREHEDIPHRGDRHLNRASSEKADNQPPDRGSRPRGGLESSHDDSPWSSSAAPSARFENLKEQFQKERDAFLRDRQQHEKIAPKPRTDGIEPSDEAAAGKAELSVPSHDMGQESHSEPAVGVGAEAAAVEAGAAPPVPLEDTKPQSQPSKPPVDSLEARRPSASEELPHRRPSNPEDASFDPISTLSLSSLTDGIGSKWPIKGDPMHERSSSQSSTSLRNALRDAKEQAARLASKPDRSGTADEGSPDTSMPVQANVQATASLDAVSVEAEREPCIVPPLGFEPTASVPFSAGQPVEATDGSGMIMHPFDPAELFRMDVAEQTQQRPHGPAQDGGRAIGTASRIFETSLLRELLGSDQGVDSAQHATSSGSTAWMPPAQDHEVASGRRAAPSRALSRWFSMQAAPEPSEDDSGEMFFTDFIRKANDTDALPTSPPFSHNPSQRRDSSGADHDRTQSTGSDVFNALFARTPASFLSSPGDVEVPCVPGEALPVGFLADRGRERHSPPAIGRPQDFLRDVSSSPPSTSPGGSFGMAALQDNDPQGSVFSVLRLGLDQASLSGSMSSPPQFHLHPGPIGRPRPRDPSSNAAPGQARPPESPTAAAAHSFPQSAGVTPGQLSSQRGADAALLSVLRSGPSGEFHDLSLQDVSPSLHLNHPPNHRRPSPSEDAKSSLGGPALLSKLFEAADSAQLPPLPRPPPTKALTLEDIERSQVLQTIEAATSTSNSQPLAPTAMASMTGSVARWFSSLPDTLPAPREIEPSLPAPPLLPSRDLSSPYVTEGLGFPPPNHDAPFMFANQPMPTSQRQMPPELPPHALDNRLYQDASLAAVDPSVREMFRPAPPFMPFPIARDSPTMGRHMAGLYGSPPSRVPMRPMDVRGPAGPLHRPGMPYGPLGPFPDDPRFALGGPMGPMAPFPSGMPFPQGPGFPMGPEQHPFRPAGPMGLPMGHPQHGMFPPMQGKMGQMAPPMGMGMGMGVSGPMRQLPPGFPGDGMGHMPGGNMPPGAGFNQPGPMQGPYGPLGPPMRPRPDAWPGGMSSQSPPPPASGGNLLDKLFEADVATPLPPMPNHMRSLADLEANNRPRT